MVRVFHSLYAHRVKMKGLDDKRYNDEVPLLIYLFIFLNLYASFKKKVYSICSSAVHSNRICILRQHCPDLVSDINISSNDPSPQNMSPFLDPLRRKPYLLVILFFTRLLFNRSFDFCSLLCLMFSNF
jgi:hypothetical protein